LIPAEANFAKPSFTFAPVLHDVFEGDFFVIGSPCVGEYRVTRDICSEEFDKAEVAIVVNL
jgi:hypothetical protein